MEERAGTIRKLSTPAVPNRKIEGVTLTQRSTIRYPENPTEPGGLRKPPFFSTFPRSLLGAVAERLKAAVC